MAKTQDFFTILDGRVKMVNRGYKTTADAIWLGTVATTKKNQTVLDVGIGAGGISLSMLIQNPNIKITGIDISDERLNEAAENAKLNNQELNLINADILNWKTGDLFDIVITNPPYFKGSARTDGAHHNADIYKWVMQSLKRLKGRGIFYTIVAPMVMDKVIAALHDSVCGNIKIIPLYTKNGIERTIIIGRKNVSTPSEIYFPIDYSQPKKI